MSKEYPCVHYKLDGICEKYSTDGVTSYCVQGPCQDEMPSNADRIRAMSDEEMATDDTVPVVKCRECKCHKPIDYCIKHKQTGWFDDDFCSRGQRKGAARGKRQRSI